jgi:hypothetical protein
MSRPSSTAAIVLGLVSLVVVAVGCCFGGVFLWTLGIVLGLLSVGFAWYAHSVPDSSEEERTQAKVGGAIGCAGCGLGCFFNLAMVLVISGFLALYIPLAILILLTGGH